MLHDRLRILRLFSYAVFQYSLFSNAQQGGHYCSDSPAWRIRKRSEMVYRWFSNYEVQHVARLYCQWRVFDKKWLHESGTLDRGRYQCGGHLDRPCYNRASRLICCGHQQCEHLQCSQGRRITKWPSQCARVWHC